MSNEQVKVSVCMTTYNHAKYLRQALDSVLSQKTTFKFEVVIHDDASTDRTCEIIREYAEKYPNQIIPLLQKENQFSKGKNLDKEFILPVCKGEYLAFLEGDDYWTDAFKLQKQYDILENHPMSAICVHRVAVVTEDGQPTKKECPSRKRLKKDSAISGMEFLTYNEYVFQTGSYFFRKRYMDELMHDRTKLSEYFNGDECILRWAIQNGDIFFINETMSVYRVNVPTGWSTGYAKHSVQQRIAYLKKSIEAELLFNEESHAQYRRLIEGRIMLTMLCANSYSYQEAEKLFKRYQPIVTSFIERPPASPFERQVLTRYRIYMISPKLHKIMRKLNHIRKSNFAR